MDTSEVRHGILLIAADWHVRALILAELQEAGYDVSAVPGLKCGLRAVLLGKTEPSLVVLVVDGDEFASPDQVKALLDVLPGIPIVLVTGAYDQAAYKPLRDRVAAFLVRPITVGDVVVAVQNLLG
ncbi:MAG TPA: hypothetical protein EYP04_04530 [Anaerolineae bacterium]|nr:hypothetical protein [Anaerolineae bacterium]HIQ05078.1 hypothetical protein [Anaerolineae bacterium]